MIQKGKDEGTIKGVKLNTHCPALHHVLFADDTAIFGKANSKEIKGFKLILDRYCAVSGQAINSTKSAIFFSANTPEEKKRTVADEIEVNTQIDLGKYLGVPTEWGSSKVETNRFILERLSNRAQSWKSSTLSHAGREIMVKSVLQAIPSYMFSCFLFPKTLTRKMDSILVNFWWAGDGGKKEPAFGCSRQVNETKRGWRPRVQKFPRIQSSLSGKAGLAAAYTT
ncbi:Putative ribonuclease H protein At1g65750 [Linum perenne]